MTEQKRKLSAKQLLADISAGMTDQDLAKKYELTAAQLQSVFQKLCNAGLLDGSKPGRLSAPTKTETSPVYPPPPSAPAQGSVEGSCSPS
jgi:hypothetical protein